MLWATIGSPHSEQMAEVLKSPLVEAVRFNTGVPTPYNADEVVEMILKEADGKIVGMDLKGRQPRIVKWTTPPYGRIELSHNIRVDIPAEIIFRGGSMSFIKVVRGNTIYVDPDPEEALGEGQAVNIHGNNLEIEGYFTQRDIEMVDAAKRHGIHIYMLSFVEQISDVESMKTLDPDAVIYAKIETSKGLEFVKNDYPTLGVKINLVAALDDLYINIGDDKTAIYDALKLIIDADPCAIAASRIFTSLEKSEEVSMQDILTLRHLESMGYGSFMLSDGLCLRTKSFRRVMNAVAKYRARFKNQTLL